MSHLPNLELLDADGAVRDAAESAGLDRSDFLKKGVIAGGGLLAGSALFTQYVGTAEAAISRTRRSAGNDVKILNFALTLEFLEAAFYRQADINKVYGDNAPLQRFTQIVRRHEAQHVAFLRGALGTKAIKKPKFDFGATVTDRAMFQKTAQTLEDTGVTAYLGQVANISNRGTLTAAGTIALVEGRHAAWIRFINGGATLETPTRALPAPTTFDKPKSERSVLKAVKDTGFIQ